MASEEPKKPTFKPIGGPFTKVPTPDVFLKIAALVETSPEAAGYAKACLERIQNSQRKTNDDLAILVEKFDEYCSLVQGYCAFDIPAAWQGKAHQASLVRHKPLRSNTQPSAVDPQSELLSPESNLKKRRIAAPEEDEMEGPF